MTPTMIEDTTAAEDAPATSTDLAEQLRQAAAELADASAAEQAATGNGDPEEHHRLADLRRWHEARVTRLRERRDAAKQAETTERHQAARAAAKRIVTEEPVGHVADAYRSAQAAVTTLIEAAHARQAAVIRAAEILQNAGANPPGASTTAVVLGGVKHTVVGVDPAWLLLEALAAVARERKLRTLGGDDLAELLTAPVRRHGASDVAKLQATETAG